MKAKLPKSILKRPPADEDRLLQVIEGKMQKMHEGMERISYPGCTEHGNAHSLDVELRHLPSRHKRCRDFPAFFSTLELCGG